jgi:anti-sigma regulatory factor (Ser/Thr protein kinase)
MRGEAAVLIATAQHRAEFADCLSKAGVDLDAARGAGRYLQFDAAQTLASFMTDSGPDERRFREVIESVLARALENAPAVHAYGEMVGLLAADGQIVAALELEALWSRLMAEQRFDLLCGYPRSAFDDDASEAGYDAVCASHDEVVARTALHAAIDLPLGPSSVAIARRAVRDVLRSWGFHDSAWLYDVTVVVSELVGNAVRHARSQVAVTLEAHDEQVTLSVADGSVYVPRPREFGDLAEDGRGFAIIGALTNRWGVDEEPAGKRVWAILRRHPGQRTAP